MEKRMRRPDTPLRIASQLTPSQNAAIAARAGDLPILILPVPRGAVGLGDGDAEVLFAHPFHKAGSIPAERPTGWPFGFRWVQLVSAGLDLYPDWIFDVPLLSNARGSLAAPIAEFCLAQIFAAAKDLPDTWIDGPEHWRLRPLRSVEGASLGVFGFGAIGETLAHKALALGMKVHAVRRSDQPLPDGVERAENLAALARVSDHLVLAAPSTPETRHIVSREILRQARPGLHLINVARGALVDDDALLEALASGHVGRASLDVTEPEPLPAGHPFYSHPQVRVSPHTSVMTPDADDRVARIFVDNLRLYLAGDALNNVISVKA
jgi:phosphoglycerate dehydrogenase-like enzyme